jgi:acyl dehydratase
VSGTTVSKTAEADFASRLFDDRAQNRFAQLSGDRNPLHMDPLYARRTQVGVRAVHGMHFLLWALDAACRARPGLVPRRISARFINPLYVGEVATAGFDALNGDETTIRVACEGVPITEISVGAAASGAVTPAADAVSRNPSARLHPADLIPTELAGQAGAVPLPSAEACAGTFPALASAVGATTLAGLVATSRIVGMECPGLHSLYSGLTLDLTNPGDASGGLRYAVVRYDPRFHAVRIEVSGGGVRGVLSAFVRQSSQAQASMNEITAHVSPQAYAGQRALIVGGSRGLGEITAKIVAAGGGAPIITYAQGRDDAEAVAESIRSWGGICSVAHYDVRQPAAAQITTLGTAPGHLYYFATCQIFRRKSSRFNPETLREFSRFYVDAFADLCESLAAIAPDGLRAFYPSTVSVDRVVAGLLEYSMAKAAGEVLCRHLVRSVSGLSILVKRLPRVLTDQTNTVPLVKAERALDVMLPIVAALGASERAALE